MLLHSIKQSWEARGSSRGYTVGTGRVALQDAVPEEGVWSAAGCTSRVKANRREWLLVQASFS